MPRERVLITVKTYPTLSSKYGETVCTAGLREDGSWVRIYPVPFRRLEEIKRYRLFEWIECTLERNYKDFRPETFRIVDPSGLRRGRRVDTSEDWRERRESVLGKAAVYRRIETLVQAAKANEASLAVFKPTRVLDFVCRETEREWDPERLAQMRAMIDQGDLFDDNAWRSTFRVVDKVPYTFHYRFEDVTGRSATLQVPVPELSEGFRGRRVRSVGQGTRDVLRQVHADRPALLRRNDSEVPACRSEPLDDCRSLPRSA